MPQSGTSLSAVSEGGSYAGSSIDLGSFYSVASMFVSMSGYAGSGAVQVVLEASADNSTWFPCGTVNFGGGDTSCSAQVSARYLRAVIAAWNPSVVAGSLTAVVAGAELAGGTYAGALTPRVVALTDAATIAVDAASGNVFSVVLGGDRTIGAPSNPSDGQVIRIRLVQPGSGGPYTVSWNSAYDFGGGSAPTLSTGATAVDIAAFEYVSAITKWCYLGSSLGN
jgi:hypothetical protein